MKIFTKIFHQTFWQILGKVVTSLSSIIILSLVARNYGELGTGIFTLALTYLGIFYIFADFGFNAHVLRTVNSQQSTVNSEWKKLLGTRLVWSAFLVIIAVGLLLLLPFATPQFNIAVLFGSLAIMVSSVFVSCNLIFQSRLRYDLSVLASSLGTLISLAIFIYFASINLPVAYLLLAHLTGWIIMSGLALFIVRMGLPIFDKTYALKLLSQSWPVAATLVLNVVYFRADAFMVAYFKGITEAGIYNIAYSVFQAALVLPTFIMNAYYPIMLKTFKGIKFIAVGLLALSLAGVALTVLLSPLIIKLLTGQGFEGSVQSLQILSLGFPAFFLSALLMWVMVSKGQYKPMLIIYGLGLVLNLLLNFIYIPKYSFLAASWITVFSEYIILLIQIFILRGIILR